MYINIVHNNFICSEMFMLLLHNPRTVRMFFTFYHHYTGQRPQMDCYTSFIRQIFSRYSENFNKTSNHRCI
jgi:hypothetical protein